MKESLFKSLGIACIVYGVLVLIALALANYQETRTHTICDAATKNCQIDN